MTDNAAPRHSGQWKKGQSGNPAGMPRGTRHRATMLAEKLLADDAENIVRAVVNAAKNGDPTAMRLCVERLVPLRKGGPMAFELPSTRTVGELVEAMAEVVRGTSSGELTVDEAAGFDRGMEEGKQPALFELHTDCRPRAERTVAGRYLEPTLLNGM